MFYRSSEMTNVSWQDQANCRGVDPDIFFPLPKDVPAERTAKAVCAACPVRSECLDYALDHRMDSGIWGGLTEKERRVILKRRRVI